MFEYDESINEYSTEIRSIQFITENPDEDTEDRATELAEAYYDKSDEIINFIIGHIGNTFLETESEIFDKNIGKPLIDMDTQQLIIPYRSSLSSHYLTVEFVGVFDRLIYFSMDG